MLDSWMGRGHKSSDGPDKVGLGPVRRPVIGLALGGENASGDDTKDQEFHEAEVGQ